MRRSPWVLSALLVAAACERDFSQPTWHGDLGGSSGDGGGTPPGDGGTGLGAAGTPSEAGEGGTAGARPSHGGAGSGGKASAGSAGTLDEGGGGGIGGDEPNRPPVAVFDFYQFERGAGAVESAAGSSGAEAGAGAAGAPAETPIPTYAQAAGALQGNDDDPDGDTLSVQAETKATGRGGNIAIASDGSFTYTPPSDRFWGDDTFSYVVSDGNFTVEGSARVTLSESSIGLANVLSAGGNGWTIGGAERHDRYLTGYYAASAGDVNGDGFDDLIVASPGTHTSWTEPGAVYVVFGRKESTPVLLDAIEDGIENGVEQSSGFMLTGFFPATLDGYKLTEGWPVNGVGDVNGDGLDDIAIASLSSATDSAPSVYVVFGRKETTPIALNRVLADGTSRSLGLRITPINPTDRFGTSVAAAGDLNGDGFADLVIGAPGVRRDMIAEIGAAYVVFGNADFGKQAVSLDDINSGRDLEVGFMVSGNRPDSRTGYSVAGAGDVNGDGLGDLVVGAPDTQPEYVNAAVSGSAYVVLGSRDPRQVDVDWFDRKSPLGFAIWGGETIAALGASVSGAGYFNPDGLEDVLAGIPNYHDGIVEFAGGAYVTFGKTEPVSDTLNPAAVPDTSYLVLGYDGARYIGRTVAAGDFDGDGWSDFALAGNFQSYEAYVAFGGEIPDGRDSNVISLHDVCDRRGVAGERALCVADETHNLLVAASSGDFNGDGVDDMAFGAPHSSIGDSPSNAAGNVYVVFGWDSRNRMQAHHVAFSGGSGDDSYDYSGGDILRISGGHGMDSIKFASPLRTWDLRTVEPTRLESIERIDLRGAGRSTLILDDDHVRSLPSTRPGLPSPLSKTLVVLGEAGDTLRIDRTNFEELEPFEGRRVFRRKDRYYGFEVDTKVTLSDP